MRWGRHRRRYVLGEAFGTLLRAALIGGRRPAPVPVCILGVRCWSCDGIDCRHRFGATVHTPRWYYPAALCPDNRARIGQRRPDWGPLPRPER